LVICTTALIPLILHPIATFLLLAANGVGFSLTNIAVNVEADRVEAASGRRIMNTCHGIWSIGFLVTALLGVLMRGSGVSPALHLGLLAPVLIAALVIVAAPMAVTPARPHAATTTRRL